MHDNLYMQKNTIVKSVEIIEEDHFLTFQKRCMPSDLKEMPRNSGIKTGRWAMWFSSRSQHHCPNLHFEANL